MVRSAIGTERCAREDAGAKRVETLSFSPAKAWGLSELQIVNICIILSMEIPHFVGRLGVTYYRLWFDVCPAG